MSLIILISVLMLIGISSINTKKNIGIAYKTTSPAKILILAFFVRILFALFFDGHETDMNCFDAWSDIIYQGGIGNFYTNGQFADYPPGYMYVLYVIGFIKNVFPMNKELSYLLLKLPAIICDILSGYMLFKISEKNQGDSSLIASLYLFNPFVILDSAIWGQVDSVFTLPIFAMLYLVTQGKLIWSYFLFAIAIFIKPQALFYAPILLLGIIEHIFIKDFSKKKLIKNIGYGVTAIILIFALSLPFGIGNVISQYIKTLASYNYASVNAYNLWSALGLNWSPITKIHTYIGYLFIAIITVLCMLQFFRRKSSDRYFYFGALICFSVFVLSVKMHERYAFPAVLLILGAFAVSGKKSLLYIYSLVSSLLFANSAHVLFYYKPESYYASSFHNLTIVFGVISLAIFVLWWAITFKNDFSEKVTTIIGNDDTKRNYKVTRFDVVAISIITVIYSAIAFFNLGDTRAPETYTVIDTTDEIVIDLGKENDIYQLRLYNGFYELSDNRTISIAFSSETGENVYSTDLSSGGVFTWNFIPVDANARYITLTTSQIAAIFELGIISPAGDEITPASAPTELFDEFTVAERSYKNSTYFDEIYHARTAYEYIHKLPVYEWTHPPLGKIFIASGIKFFGMTPFGWRFAGTLFGIFMLPAIYIFIKKVFGKTALSLCGTILLASDFMHFAQSRIATIDVYVTFFIMLMFLFMFKYYNDGLFNKNRAKGHFILALCGLSFGLAVASKWTGLYAGAGIALVFTLAIIDSYKKDKYCFLRKLITTGCLCVVFFIIIPVIIYAISYIPYLIANGEGLSGIIENQVAIFTYHGKTVVDSTHPFSSKWYEWIFNLRPIWYYSDKDFCCASSISSFGNPILWWSGIVAFVFCMHKAIHDGDKKAITLTIAYLSGIIPWTFVERTTFIYHYFPCVPFLAIMVCYVVDYLSRQNKKAVYYFSVFTALSVILFAMFYPAISGFWVSEGYLEFLKWLPRWQII